MEEQYFEATIRGCSENHEDLTGIDLSLHALVEEKVSRLAKCLEKNTHVTSLDLFGVKYDWQTQSPAPWIHLFNSLPVQLTHLELGSVKFGSAPPAVAVAAFQRIGRLTSLHELSLSANELNDSSSIESLCGSLTKLDSLHEFLVQNNKLSDISGNLFSNEGKDKVRSILSRMNTDAHRLEL